MENEEVLQDTSKPEEEVSDSENVEITQEGDTDEEKVAKLAESNKKLFARAKTAEEELKAFKSRSKVEAEKPSQPVQPVQPTEELDKKIEEKLNERELASMDLSDELKSEVKTYAKAKGVPYREVLKTPYFNYIKGQEDERAKSEDASASSTNKTTKAKRDFGNLSAGEIENLESDDFAEYKKWLKSQK